MEAQMTINDFSSYLASNDESPIQAVLRQLSEIAQPEHIRNLLAQPATCWTGWAY